MTAPLLPLQTPLSAIIFDCDGTLSAIEGIDELAKMNGVDDFVETLTADAMGKSGLTSELYRKRLDLVYPTEEQVIALGRHYFTNQVPDAAAVIQLFKRLKKSVYILSAGLAPAVSIFGELLGIAHDHIFAVNIQFDSQGLYLDYDSSSPLANRDGKRTLVTHLKTLHPDLLLIGDGLNDYAAHDLVTRFVGYGGVFYRKNIESLCTHYIRSLSMATLLPLSLTHSEVALLSTQEQRLYEKGVKAINEGPSA